jgi:hypothetical protein
VTPTNESQGKKKLKVENKATTAAASQATASSGKAAKEAAASKFNTTPPPKSPKSVSQINAGLLFIHNSLI